MAGHSHWAKVKRAKGAADAKRGNLFSKFSREITVAAKMGGGDPSFNPRLRSAIETARGESMPVDNIERAIKKGTGELAGEAYEEITYEGFAPGGIALLIEATTDNKNRAAAEIRNVFSKNGGNMAGAGSVAWMFGRKGLISIDNGKATEDQVLEVALEAGAEDIRTVDAVIEVITEVARFEAVRSALEKKGIAIQSAKLTYLPSNLTPLSDETTARQVFDLMEALDSHDDVQQVHANFDIPSELMARMG